MGQGFKSFEDIEAWQIGIELARQVLQACDQPPLARAFSFKDQISRAALSIVNNIAEGFGRYSDAEFIRFLRYSRGSAIEVESMTILGAKAGLINDEVSTEWRALCRKVVGKTTALINYLSNHNPRT